MHDCIPSKPIVNNSSVRGQYGVCRDATSITTCSNEFPTLTTLVNNEDTRWSIHLV